MADWNKPDWNKEVRARMTKLKLPPDTKEEVIAELSAHLEDINDDPSHGAIPEYFCPPRMHGASSPAPSVARNGRKL